MLVPVKTVKEARRQLKSLWQDESSLGFVPTMGALHEGHLSLIRRSIKENQFTTVSIFVNPTQFNEKHDFNHYPRNLETDLEIMASFPIDLVFIDRDGNAVAEQRDVKPGRILQPVRGGWATLELNGGRLDNLGLSESIAGSKLLFKAA